MLWLTVSRPRHGVGHPFGAHDQILLFPFFCRTIALLFTLGRSLGFLSVYISTDRTENTSNGYSIVSCVRSLTMAA
jgi:hypothetical protein